MGEDVSELEHVIGFTGKSKSTLHYHPTMENTIVYGMGAVVVIQNLKDAHQQDFCVATTMMLVRWQSPKTVA